MADYNDSNAPGTGYTGYGGDNWVDPSIEAQRLAAEKAQKEHTAKNVMSRDEFLKKYAIGEGGTFVANDKGGNAASEVAGQSVAEYYDRYLAPGAKGDPDPGHWDNPNPEGTYAMPTGVGHKYRDAHPYFDMWDNVNPHPESQDLGGVGEFWRQIGRPVAAAAALYTGVGALGAATAGWSAGAAAGTAGSAGIGSGTVLGGGAATGATAASGLAGTLGMNAGMGATALNAGALNTGISLVQGKNIGDSLKSGVMAAALSPVGGWAKGAIGEATAGLGAGVSKVLGTVGAGAATGAAGAALTGQDVGKGFTNGIISGAINTVSGAVGKIAKDATDSNLAGGVTSAVVNSAISGKKKNLAAAAINGVVNDFEDPMSSVNKYLGWAQA